MGGEAVRILGEGLTALWVQNGQGRDVITKRSKTKIDSSLKVAWGSVGKMAEQERKFSFLSRIGLTKKFEFFK